MAYFDTPKSTPLPPPSAPLPRAVLAGVQIPFWDLVWLMVKVAFAAIPAVIIIWGICFFLGLFSTAIATMIGLAVR